MDSTWVVLNRLVLCSSLIYDVLWLNNSLVPVFQYVVVVIITIPSSPSITSHKVWAYSMLFYFCMCIKHSDIIQQLMKWILNEWCIYNQRMRNMFAFCFTKSLVILTILVLNLLVIQPMNKSAHQQKPSIVGIHQRMNFHVSFQSSFSSRYGSAQTAPAIDIGFYFINYKGQPTMISIFSFTWLDRITALSV